MKDFDSIKTVTFRRMFLLVYDICAIVMASYLALLIRFEFVYDKIEPRYLNALSKYILIHILITIILFYIFRLYHSLWAFAGFAEIQNVITSCFFSTCTYYIAITILNLYLPKSFYVLYGLLLTILLLSCRLMYRYVRQHYYKIVSEKNAKNTMIVGAGEAGSVIIKEIVSSKYVQMKAKCVIDDDRSKKGNFIQGVKIVGDRHSIVQNVEKYNIDTIIIAIPTASKKNIKEIVEFAKKGDVEKIGVGADLNSSKATFVEGYAPRNVDLNPGLNKITLKVRSESGVLNVYTINVNKGE